MKFLILLAALAAVGHCSPISTFEQYKLAFGKHYATEAEEAFRRAAFQESLAWINANQGKDGVSYGLNEFSDLSTAEFHATRANAGFNMSELFAAWADVPAPVAQLDEYEPGLPESYDWRQHMHTNPIENQGQCGSCWAFATAGVTEMLYAIRRKQNIRLSKQELVDCASHARNAAYKNEGCKFGYTLEGYRYIHEHGLLEDTHYPYNGRENSCAARSAGNRFRIAGGHQLRYRANDDEIMRAIIAHGPIVFMIHSGTDAFRHYHGNSVMRGVSYNDATVDHILIAVGWGRSNGVDYWIIRNSWGTGWGDNGYLYIERHHNSLGVNNFVAYADL